MSFLGGLFGSDKPDEKFMDDQTVQEDQRDNKYVGPVIDTACTVYDSMFDALKFVLRGRANVIENLDKVVEKLEKQCQKIIDKYKEILSKMNEVGAGLSVDLSIDIARDSFDLLNSNPVLRRYIGEANYWALWDTLAALAGEGSNISGDTGSNIKDSMKGIVYALLSMTNGLMHFESYLSQITQFWGYLYSKEISLQLTDSICPQVTCQYYYKPVIDGNPVPGPDAYAPMPFPKFDYTKPASDIAAFRYDDPDTWDVLTPVSRAQFQKARAYWKSNYTNAYSANDLLTSVSNLVTSNSYTIGFGHRNTYPDGGSPLKVGSTFHQLDIGKSESFPVKLLDDVLADAFVKVDASYHAFINSLSDESLVFERDTRIREYLKELGYADEDIALYVGKWWQYEYVTGGTGEPDYNNAGYACYSVIKDTEPFKDYLKAIVELCKEYGKAFGDPFYHSYGFTDLTPSPLVQYLLDIYGKLAEDSSLASLSQILKKYQEHRGMGGPYAVYSDVIYDDTEDPPEGGGAPASMVYGYAIYCFSDGNAPFYSAVSAVLSDEIDADGELGHKIYKGREPLFAAIGIYGNLLGLHPWEYEVVPLDTFKENWTRIKGSYHIYYKNTDPSLVIFADRTIQLGTLKYIATCKAAETDLIQRGSEKLTTYIFPSETCAVVPVPLPGEYLGTEFPSFFSTQRIDATSPNGDQAFMYDLTTNTIPRYPKYVDSEKWSVMDLIHELWLLAESLAPICGDGGKRKADLNDLLNEFGLNVRENPSGGPLFIGQLPTDGQAQHVTLEFTLMADFAARLREMIDEVYKVRDEVLVATQVW